MESTCDEKLQAAKFDYLRLVQKSHQLMFSIATAADIDVLEQAVRSRDKYKDVLITFNKLMRYCTITGSVSSNVFGSKYWIDSMIDEHLRRQQWLSGYGQDDSD